MAATTNGLTNGGATTHYAFTYDDSLGAPLNPGGPEPARTNAVIAGVRGRLQPDGGWFNNIALDVNFTIPVNVTQNSGGAGWSLSGGNLTVTINPGNRESADFMRYLLVAEMVEQFMRAQGRGWYGKNTEGSQGEGLSRFLSLSSWSSTASGNPVRLPQQQSWLSSPRAGLRQQHQLHRRRARCDHWLRTALHLVPVRPARVHDQPDRRRRSQHARRGLSQPHRGHGRSVPLLQAAAATPRSRARHDHERQSR